VVEIRRARRPSAIEYGFDLLQGRDDPLRLLVAARLRRALVPLELLFDGRQVGQRELRVDRLDVGDRVDLACDVDDVVVFEAADDMRDGVRLADVREELVAQASPSTRRRRAAMSTNSTVAGITFSGCAIAASAGRRASGTSTMPTFGSIVQNG
jgi:hypothetical protein